MPWYLITDKLTTYATTMIEAPSATEAMDMARDGDPDWNYETDYDTPLGMEAREMPNVRGTKPKEEA